MPLKLSAEPPFVSDALSVAEPLVPGATPAKIEKALPFVPMEAAKPATEAPLE